MSENHHRYKGFNLLAASDANLLRMLLRGEFNSYGFTSRNLRRLIPDKTAGQVSRLVKRRRVHGRITKVGKTYEYYLTQAERNVHHPATGHDTSLIKNFSYEKIFAFLHRFDY